MRSSSSAPLYQLRWSATNLRLRSTRSILTVLGVAIAVAIFVGVSAFYAGYRSSLTRSIERLGFEVLVTAKGCPYEAASLFLRGGNIPMYIDETVGAAVANDAAVRRASRLFLQTLPADDGRHHLFLGVDDSFLAMKPWLEVALGGWFEGPEAMEAVLGYNAATELGAVPGDVLELPRLPLPLTVAGILARAGSQDDGTIFLPLRTAQRLFDKKNRVTGIGIKVQDVELLPDYCARVQEMPGIQVISMSQAEQGILELAGTAERLMRAVGILTAIVAALALVNTLLMTILERRREFATLRAVGASRKSVFVAIVLEAELLCLLGALLGVGLAFVFSSAVEQQLRQLLPFSPPGPLVEIDGSVALLALAATLGGGVVCSLYPALRSSRLDPAKVMAGR